MMRYDGESLWENKKFRFYTHAHTYTLKEKDLKKRSPLDKLPKIRSEKIKES